MSPLTRAYLAFSAIADPAWRFAMNRRLKRGKETPDRLPEKFAQGYPPRPDGEVLWFHALSVGESLALLPIFDRARVERPDATILLTTSTASSVNAFDRIKLPPNVIHILLPVDTAKATGAFLHHWCPSLAAIAEIDFWPRLMVETARRDVPMILLNARLYRDSVESRGRLGGMMKDLLGLFRTLLVQDDASAKHFAALGAPRDRITVTGALKAAARPLDHDAEALADLNATVADRPLWLAAATEASEHPAMIEAHVVLLETVPDALLIVAPRHTRDGAALADLATGAGLTPALRSKGEPITPETQVYIANTIGEMGLWYRLAPVAFVGHSLPGHGLTGKNPFEAAALDCAILTGPDVADFAESFADLEVEGATRVVHSAHDLAAALEDVQDPAKRQPMTEAARRVVARKAQVLETTWSAIEALLT